MTTGQSPMSSPPLASAYIHVLVIKHVLVTVLPG